MRFWILLFLLGWRMRWLAKHNDAFKSKLGEKNAIIQFRTEDGKVARHIIVQQQMLQSISGLHSEPTMCLAFKDAKYAFGLILKTARDRMAIMKAMGSRDVVVTGEAQDMMWFMGLFKFLPPRKKK